MPAIGNSNSFRAKGVPPPRIPPPPKSARTAPPVDVPHGSGVLTTGKPATVRPASAYMAPAPKQVVPDVRPHGLGTLTKVTPGSTQPKSAYQNPESYAQAVLNVFKAQPPAQQQAIVQGALKSPNSAESKVILQHLQAFPGQASQYASTPKGLLSGIPGAVSSGLGDVASALDYLQNQRPNMGPAEAGLAPQNLGKVLVNAPIDVTRAAIESPSVIPKTAKGLADSVAGLVAATGELPIKAVQEGPLTAGKQLVQSVAQDYSRRYGPLVAGNDRAFIDRIKKEGAGPELFDALGVVGGADATLGRGFSALAKTRAALTGEENFLTRPRPNLLLSGNKERSQTLANTAGRATAQRLEDYLRSKRHGELVPKVGQVAPLFQSHAIRVVHSGVAQRWRRMLQENLQREVRGRPGSALHAIGRLSNIQQQAIYHAVHGIRMDTSENLRADLADRRAEILKERANPESIGNRIPAQYADKVDELKLIDRLMANADKIAGPKMVKFQAGEAARAQRIEAQTALHPATAEARRLRPIGDRLGIEHPDVAAQRMFGETGHQDIAQFARGRKGAVAQLTAQQERALREYELARPQYLAKYVQRVRAAMKEKDLPEPGYFKHQERPDVKYGDFTSGSGGRAMSAGQQSDWILHRAGVADTSPDAYLQGLARSIKRPLQWRLTDEQLHTAAIPSPTSEEIERALGSKHNEKPNASQTPEQLRHTAARRTAADLTGNELRRVYEQQGVDMNKVVFVNPGRLAERTLAEHGRLPEGKTLAETHDAANAELHGLLNQEDVVQKPSAFASHAFMTKPGWFAIPKTAFDEIHGNLKGGSLGGRAVGKVQGLSAGLILGQNPHFLIMNTLAHAIPAIAGTKGRILGDLARFPMWWHGLTDQERDLVRGFGGGRGGHYNTTARLGSQAPNKIAAFGRQLESRGLVQRAKSLNPLHAILRAEDIQSNYFRNAVMYHETKRAAFQDMSHEYGRAVAQWESVKHVFSIKDPQERMRVIMNDMPRMEELGRTTVNILGDYGRFTNRERQFFNNRAVLFYSFLRHVTRTLLYVLPARHPLALGLLGELGNLHTQEVKKLMGGQDMPWAYGRIFFDNKGKLRSIDLTSTSPISSPLVDILSGGVKQLPRLISPVLAPLLDVAYGQTPTGQPVQRNALTYFNDLASLSYPYRMASVAKLGLAPQQSDSIPFIHERPKVYKTKAGQAYANAKEQARGPLSQYLLGSALGLYPKPDDTRVIAQHAAARATAHQRNLAKKKGGGGWGPTAGAPATSGAGWGPSTTSTAGGGGWGP